MKKNVKPPIRLPEITWTRESASMALAEIMEKHPDLCSHGMGIYCDYKRNHFLDQAALLKTDRDELVAYLHNVAWVATWCQQNLSLRKSVNNGTSSYSLKHIAEISHPRGYITNGEFIAGAMIAGLEYKITRDFPNVYFNISNTCLSEFQRKQSRRGDPDVPVLPLPFEKIDNPTSI